MINYYVILEIPNFSDTTIIKKAYRSLSKKYHPDLNNDPAAHNYFLKIQEAYDYLMNENKRLLLNQYIESYNLNKNTYQTRNQENNYNNYQNQNSNNSTQNNKPLPIVHIFYCDRKSYSLNDYIFLQWNVSNCKSVKINILGNVSFQGSQYYQITKFKEKLIIKMEIVGLDDQMYTSEIVLKYFNENPTIKAYHQMLSKNPNTKQIHFKQEQFLNSFSRISKLTFVNRFIALILLLTILSYGFIKVIYPHFYFILICATIGTIWLQCVKRCHDLASHKHNSLLLLIPILNFKIIKDLFTSDSEKGTNEYGVYPKQEKLTFFLWIYHYAKLGLQKLSSIEKVSIASFFIVMFFYSYQGVRNYDEHQINFTNYGVEYNRSGGSNSQKKYQLEFDNSFWINVTENEYQSVVNKEFNQFKVGVSSDNQIKYIKGINTETNQSRKFGTGLMNNSNPLILLIALMFFGQIYVITQFKKPNEKFYGEIYLGFSIFIYIVIIINYLL